MPERTRHIGLSLGADICWPICYEALLKQLDLAIDVNGETQRFDVERVLIEPFALDRFETGALIDEGASSGMDLGAPIL